MSIAVYYLLILLLLAHPHKKELGRLAFFYLLLLFCLNTNIADREGYEIDMYNAVYNEMINFEPIWNGLLSLMEINKISVLYMLVGIVYLPTLYFFINRLSRNNNTVLACYMIGVFFLDVVQLRYSFSLVFVFLGLNYLLFENKKKGSVIFIGSIIVASMIHLSNLIFLLFYFAKKLSTKKVYFVSVAGFVVLTVSYTLAINYLGDIFNMASKMQRINDAEYTSINTFLLTTISELAAFGLMWFTQKHYHESNIIDDDLINIIYNAAIMSLMFIPIINFSQDIRRHIYVMFIIITAVLFRTIRSCSRRSLLQWAPILIAIIYFVSSVYTGNRDTVFFPLFDSNLLF